MPTKFIRIAIATVGDRGLEDHVSGHFGYSKTYTIVEIEKGRVKSVKVTQNPALSLSRGVGRTAAQHLASMGVNTVISGEVGPGASMILDELSMKKLVVTAGQRVMDVLRKKKMVAQ